MKKISIVILSLFIFIGFSLSNTYAKSDMTHGQNVQVHQEKGDVSVHGEKHAAQNEHDRVNKNAGEHGGRIEHGSEHGESVEGFITKEMSGSARLPLFAVFIPIFGAFLILIFGKSEKLRQGITVISAILGFVALLMMLGPVLTGIQSADGLFKGILYKIDYFTEFSFSFKVDPIGLVIALVVNFLWMMSVIYALGYMKPEHAKTRYDFFVLMSLAANVGVILAGDLFTMFIFFESLLLMSYPLVMHLEDAKAKNAAKIYLYMGVATGLFFLAGIFLLYHFTGNINIEPMGEKLLGLGAWKYIIAGLMIFGLGGKAGIFFEHIWLPSAHPVAPSPASALLSGAMIKAGAYGILRVVNMFFMPDLNSISGWLTMNNIGYVMIWVGILTMFLGVLNALISSNSKQMLAFHSVSQMGYILMGIGCAAYLGKDGAMGLSGAVYHIINHALFKASLFMCVGAVYFRTHELDMYKLGGLRKNMPVTAICLFIAVCGISGIPGFNGFASKTLLHHSIVEAYEHSSQYMGKPDQMLKFAEIIFMLTAGGTFASNIKLFILTFMGKRREEHNDVKEVPLPMKLGMIGFSIAILFIGIFPNFLLEHIIGPGLAYFGYNPASHPYHVIYNVNSTGLHSTIPILFDPVKRVLFSSSEVLHNLGGVGNAILLGGAYFVLGFKFGWFHVQVPETLSVGYYYRKALAGFIYFCQKPCLVFSILVNEFISTVTVYMWVPGSHQGIFMKRPMPKIKGFESYSDAETTLNLLDEKTAKHPEAMEAFDRADTAYEGQVDKGVDDKKRTGAWGVFDRVDTAYDGMVGKSVGGRSGAWGVFNRADSVYGELIDKSVSGKKHTGIWDVFSRVDQNYDSYLGEVIQNQGGIWRIFGKTDMTYDTILDRVIAAITGLEEIPISRIEEEVLAVDPIHGEDLVTAYNLFCDANRSVDINVIDGIVNGLANLTSGLGGLLRKLQTGRIASYSYSFVLGAVLMMLLFLFR